MIRTNAPKRPLRRPGPRCHHAPEVLAVSVVLREAGDDAERRGRVAA
jgi:hypothetical protein